MATLALGLLTGGIASAGEIAASVGTDLALASGTSFALAGKKRIRNFEFDFSSPKKAKTEIVGQPMASRRIVNVRRKRKRRSRRRGRRRLGFARRVKRIIFRNNEPKRAIVNFAEDTDLVVGNTTARIVVVYGITQFLTQGVQDGQFIGNQVRLKGLSVRGQVECQQTTSFSNFYVVYTLIRSRQTSVITQHTGNVYGATTTSAVGPTQTTPHSNLSLFRAATTPEIHTGQGFLLPFDTTNVKILGQKIINVNAGGGENSVVGFKFWFPLKNKLFTYIDPVQSDLSAGPNHGKYGGIFLVRQLISGAEADDEANTTSLGELDHHMELFFRDP